MDASTLISGIAVVIAIMSFVVGTWRAQRAELRARKPVLVFVDDPSAGCWTIRNVGNGPALNIVTAQRKSGQWFNPVKIPPLGSEGSYQLPWLGRTNETGLGATYADFEGTSYTATLGDEVSRTFRGRRLPLWPDADVARYWDVEDYHPSDPLRHPRQSDFSA